MKSKFLLFCVAVSVALSGCAGISTQLPIDPVTMKIDPMATASLQVAVGSVLSSNTTAIQPTYAATTGILAVLDGAGILSSVEIPTLVDSEISKLNVDAMTKQSVKEVVALACQWADGKLKLSSYQSSQQVSILKQVIRVVQSSAAARLPRSVK